MPREPTRNQINQGLTYVAQKPAFLANFGKPPPSEREPIPTRPDDGEWAAGSDEEEDEWDARFGGGEDGPQVVVLKEGRHLSADEVARERRKAKGEKSPTPDDGPSASKTSSNSKPESKESKPDSSSKPEKPGPLQHKAKRKLVGEAVDHAPAPAEKKKKKKKANKGMLSFNEEEGE